MSSSYRLSLNNWLSTLDVVSPNVYDIGGSQEPLEPRVKSWNVEDYVVFDLEQPHKGSKKPDVVLDLNKAPSGKNKSAIDYYGTAEMVFCLEVFDYVYDPMQALRTLKNLLARDGRLFITFPSQYPLHNPIEDDALRYMPGGIKKLAAASGLKIVKMIPRHFETNMFQQFVVMERLRAAKHEDHSIAGWIVEFKR